MAEAYASTIIPAPVEAVWSMVRDFNGMPAWNPKIGESRIEGGLSSDVVGCIRDFSIVGGGQVRERLLSLDDSRYRFSYNFITPAFPIENYLASFELIPVSDGDRCFAHWHASFDEAPEDRGRYVSVVSEDVFASGLRALASAVSRATATAVGGPRWQGLRPAKVFCSSVLHAPIGVAWGRIRDFAGMGDWHDEISDMHMLDAARSDQIGAVRDFIFGKGRLQEQLTFLCDRTHSFRYKINASEMAWLNYHAGARLYPITATDETLAVWTADWTASPIDDVELIPNVHNNVFQRAFDTLNTRYFGEATR